MRPRRTIVPVDLKDIYSDRGEYSVKFLVDSSMSQGLGSCVVEMYDCVGNRMRSEFKRWGTKVNVFFSVDDSVPDGAAIIELTMSGSAGIVEERFRAWVVK